MKLKIDPPQRLDLTFKLRDLSESLRNDPLGEYLGLYVLEALAAT